jgi:hypothetical protein
MAALRLPIRRWLYENLQSIDCNNISVVLYYAELRPTVFTGAHRLEDGFIIIGLAEENLPGSGGGVRTDRCRK